MDEGSKYISQRFCRGWLQRSFFRVFSLEVPSATPPRRALELDRRRVNERIQKKLSRAIYITFTSKYQWPVRGLQLSQETEIPYSSANVTGHTVSWSLQSWPSYRRLRLFGILNSQSLNTT